MKVTTYNQNGNLQETIFGINLHYEDEGWPCGIEFCFWHWTITIWSD